MIPKLSAPLVKDIRTGEGILEWLLAAADVAAGVTGNLSLSHTALYATILAVTKGTRRGLLKLVAVQKAAGIDAPLVPGVLSNVTHEVDQVLGEVGVGGSSSPLTDALAQIETEFAPAAALSPDPAPQAAPPAPAPA